MRSHAEKAKIFKDLHHGSDPFVMANVWDAGTARLFAGLGYKALATTSAGFAFFNGWRDGAGDFGLSEHLDHARKIVEAVDLPINGDLENGYSDDPEGVAGTIRQAAEAGLVGCSIEDTHPGDDKYYSFDHAVARIEAAAAAARALPDAFTLTARADGLIVGHYDLAEAIRRLQAFEAAGADVLYAPGTKDLDTIRRVVSAVGKPVNVVMGFADPSITLEQLSEAGVRRVSVGGAMSRVALAAFVNAAREMREQGGFTFIRDMLPAGELRDFFRGGH